MELQITRYFTPLLLALLLSSCGGPSARNEDSNPESALPEEPEIKWQDIRRGGERNGGRIFLGPKGDTLFGGKTFYNTFEFKNNYCIVTQMIDSVELRGAINVKGEIAIPITHKEYLNDAYEGYFMITNPKRGFLDSTGKMVIPMEYTNSKRVTDGMVKLEKKYRKWGILRMDGTELVPFKYDYLGPWRGNLSKVKIRNKYGFIDKTGAEVISAKYQMATSFENERALVKKNGKIGLINEKEEVISDFQYDEIKYIVDVVDDNLSLSGFSETNKRFMMEEGYIVLRRGDKWGYINQDGEEIVPFDYDYVGIPGRNSPAIVVTKDGKRGRFEIATKEVKWNDEEK